MCRPILEKRDERGKHQRKGGKSDYQRFADHTPSGDHESQRDSYDDSPNGGNQAKTAFLPMESSCSILQTFSCYLFQPQPFKNGALLPTSSLGPGGDKS
jgi:hypothetical protein